jgi:hypothetical protein
MQDGGCCVCGCCHNSALSFKGSAFSSRDTQACVRCVTKDTLERATQPNWERLGGFLQEVTPKLSLKGWVILVPREKRGEGLPSVEVAKCKGKRARES